jgi:predicted RNA binding protein YcfA (HicA-like mRNA interferase family)
MPRLPVCSGEEAIRAFEKAGWQVDRRRGSHVSMFKDGVPVVLTIPLHKELDRGLLRSQIRKSGLTVRQFIQLLKD